MERQPNVLLLVFDALRPDFLSAYGGPSTRVTPGFDRVANDGTLFENAFTVGRNTPVSHGVMFTGRYPSDTGLVGGFRSVPEDSPTLAGHLNGHGYDTFAISRKSGRLSSDFGHDRGFDEFYEPNRENAIPSPDLSYLRTAFSHPRHFREFLRTLRYGPEKTTRLKFELLEDRIQKADSPFFGFVNQTTTHGPYRPPRPYRSRSVPSFEQPRFYATELIGDALGVETTSLDHPGVRSSEVKSGDGFQDHNFNGEGWLNESELSIIREWYGALVAYLDSQLCVFLESLAKMGELDNTVLILTADHGEHLGEHDIVGHSHFLFDEVMQVPLLVSGPGVPKGQRRTDLVSLIDLYKTVCDLCNLPSPEKTAGKSLFGPANRDAVFAEYGIRDVEKMGYGEVEGHMRERIEAGLKCVRTAEYKFTLDSNGEEHLYELPAEREVTDPDEQRLAPLREALFDAVGSEFKTKLEHDETEVDEESLENLRELGYLK